MLETESDQNTETKDHKNSAEQNYSWQTNNICELAS